jgi:hypothetical protein
MIRKSFRIGLKLGLLAAAAAVVVKVVQSRQVPAVVPRPAPAGSKPSWPPVQPESAPAPAPAAQPEPTPEATPEAAVDPVAEVDPPPRTRVRPLKAVRNTTPDAVGGGRWVEPNGDVCPSTHPIKAKLSSKIYHLVGGRSYDRTNPDRCYANTTDAEADGLRAAKR